MTIEGNLQQIVHHHRKIQEELKQEKESRKGLEQRIPKVEKETKEHKPTAPADDMGIVEKDQIVISGFSDMDGDEVEKLVLARFDSPAMAMKMKIEHDKHDPKNLVVKYDGFMFAFGMI